MLIYYRVRFSVLSQELLKKKKRSYTDIKQYYNRNNNLKQLLMFIYTNSNEINLKIEIGEILLFVLLEKYML